MKNSNKISGQLHVWTLDDRQVPAVVVRDSHVTDSHKIGSPGSAAAAVTVSAFVTRTHWKDIDGNDREVGLTLNKMADFSSQGPLRTGAKKPDVAAPGAMIVSCLSRDSDAERATIIDVGHYAEAGTSMACPFVSGIIALLLERDPTISPAAVKAALKTASKIPGRAAGTFDAKWGFGLMDSARL